MKMTTKNRLKGPRTGLASVEAGDSRLADRTTKTAPTASEAGLANGVEIRTASATVDAERRVAERMAQIASHSPSRAGLFQSVYYGRRSKALAVKAKCLDCSCWQVERIKDCSSVICPLWRVRPYQDGRSCKMRTRGRRFWRRTSAPRVNTAEA